MDVSVVIPTYERAPILLETLEQLAKVDFPGDRWEVIVVDDGSRPETVSTIVYSIERLNVRVRLVEQAHCGAAGARNRGVLEATGDIVIFLDNDCVVTTSFIRRHVKLLREHPGCWVVGRVIHPPEVLATPFGRYRDECLTRFHLSHAAMYLGETEGVTAQNLSVRRSEFIRLGGFDEGFSIASCEDWELGQRARDAGLRILYDPCNSVVHQDWAVTLDHFCERQRLYSISDVLLWRKYGERSFRARLVDENAPVRWAADPARVAVKKLIKRWLATRTGTKLVKLFCTLTEQVAPDTRLNRRAYALAVGVAIFRGVREGLVRYGGAAVVSAPTVGPPTQAKSITRQRF